MGTWVGHCRTTLEASRNLSSISDCMHMQELHMYFCGICGDFLGTKQNCFLGHHPWHGQDQGYWDVHVFPDLWHRVFTCLTMAMTRAQSSPTIFGLRKWNIKDRREVFWTSLGGLNLSLSTTIVLRVQLKDGIFPLGEPSSQGVHSVMSYCNAWPRP